MEFESEIRRIGLSDKETAVYLAALELGPSPVQAIARRAKIARSTTYLVLESLHHRGLAEQRKNGKKTLFIAESPAHLLEFIKTEEQNLHQRREEIENLVPKLQALMRTVSEKPTVEYYSGLDGLRAMRQQMLRQSRAGDTWYNFTPVDSLYLIFGSDQAMYSRQRSAKGIRSKAICATKSAKLKKQLISEVAGSLNERKFVPLSVYNSTSGLTVYDGHIAIGNFSGELAGMIIDSPPMAQLMVTFFELLWEKL